MSADDTSDVATSGPRAGDYNRALVRIIDAQIDTWTDHCQSPITIARRRPKGRSRAQPDLSATAAAGTVALVAHGFELARLVGALMPSGLTPATSPTVRAILEVAAVVHWLTTDPAAGDAWMDSIHRSRRLLRQDMNSSTLWGTHAASVPDADHAEAQTRDQLLERCKELHYDQHVLYVPSASALTRQPLSPGSIFRIQAMAR